MNIQAQIKQNRTRLSLSQEELAEQVFVSRQTISSWETGKSYPDIHSLLLLSKTFDTSIDDLIKGDLKEMEKIVSVDDVRKFNHLYILYFILLGLATAGITLAWNLANIVIGVVTVILFGLSMFVGVLIERLKKQYDVQSYREIIAFSKGKTLDEIQKIQEKAKRPYQMFIGVLISMALGAAMSTIILFVMNVMA